MVQETAPAPILGARCQSAPDWVAVNVAEFLDALVFTPHGKVVIAWLPETRQCRRAKIARGGLLEHLQDDGEFASFRFTDQQMNMLRHDDVADYAATVPAANTFQRLFEYVPRFFGIEQRHALVATEGDEVQAALVLVAFGLGHFC